MAAAAGAEVVAWEAEACRGPHLVAPLRSAVLQGAHRVARRAPLVLLAALPGLRLRDGPEALGRRLDLREV